LRGGVFYLVNVVKVHLVNVIEALLILVGTVVVAFSQGHRVDVVLGVKVQEQVHGCHTDLAPRGSLYELLV
jgi:hypothetical protein